MIALVSNISILSQYWCSSRTLPGAKSDFCRHSIIKFNAMLHIYFKCYLALNELL